MNTQRQDDLRIAERAADWFLTLKADPGRQVEFGAWLRESPRHLEEFLLVTAAYRELDALPRQPPVDVGALRGSLSADVVPLGHRAAVGRPGSGARWRWTAGAVAACLVGVMMWMLAANFLTGERYATAIGEVRSVELQDRSVMHLNTDSELRVRYSSASRDIDLRQGEALFKVARDSQRPFRVHADGAVIQAIGTEFNVYRRPRGTLVSVVEGRVRIAGVDLDAGMEANIGPDGRLGPVAAANLDRRIAWRQGRILFKNDSLSDVAAEFNRYNRTLRIRIGDEAAARQQLTGIFNKDDPDSLLLFLESVPGLEVKREGQEVVVARER